MRGKSFWRKARTFCAFSGVGDFRHCAIGAGMSGPLSALAGWLRKCHGPCGFPLRMLGETSGARSHVFEPSVMVRLMVVRSQA